MSAYTLAEALASRLNAVVPRPIHVLVERPSSTPLRREADVVMRVANGDKPWSGQTYSNIDFQPHRDASPGDAACDMAIAMIGGVQDGVIRFVGDAWPRLPTGNVAVPDGRVDSERLYLWFAASEDHAVLTLPPIELREILP